MIVPRKIPVVDGVLLYSREVTNMTAQLIDLSHTVEDGLITYKGLPAPIICDYLSREESRAHYAEGTEFHIGRQHRHLH